MAKINYFTTDIADLHEKLMNHEITSVELTKSTIENIKERDRLVDAYLHINEADALAQAAKVDESGITDSLLSGIPVSIKDNILTKDIPTTAASKMLENFVPIFDATVVTKLKESGAIILGKTNMDEFAMGSSNETSYFKPTKNPWDLGTVPGGSSGGSAASVASGEIIASLGSDTGGSIRQPAAFNGIVGMKPTYGRVSRYGLIAFASSLDQIGPLTRSVRDNAIMLSAIYGTDENDPTTSEKTEDFTRKIGESIAGLKIGVIKEFMGEGVASEVTAEIEKSIEIFKELGAEISEVSLPHAKYSVPVYSIIGSSEASSNLARFDGVRYGYTDKSATDVTEVYVNSRTAGFGPEVQRRIMLGTFAISEGNYKNFFEKAAKIRRLINEEIKDNFKELDVLIGPTAPTTAFKFGEEIDNPVVMYMNDMLTIPSNISGIPAISIPAGLGRDTHRPVGLQIYGHKYDEATIYQIAYAFEQATKFNEQTPKMVKGGE